ncbi:TfoX/Sxy family protein [Rhodanobacter sp. C05]|uniref:TfoX/Sxy family protein n=1 Tax=Rhodanobacter sp. C05 TaxID=1945855 RepID=UPI0020C58E44|nr:TfoX/Sxy family protein [Rhodanobacter sp. C05]
MPVALDAMRRELEDAATHLGKPHDLRFKPMFGGLMAYFDEQPCAWLTVAGLALKLAPADQLALLRLEGAARLIAKPGAAPSRHYIIVPAVVCRDTTKLAEWLARSGQWRAVKPRSVHSSGRR